MSPVAPTRVWLAILICLMIVLALRWSFLVLPRRFQPRGALAEALGYAPLAALVAICVPEVAKFQIAQMSHGFDLPSFLDVLKNDWRVWSAIALIATVMTAKRSKSAALFGLAAAALVIVLM